MKQHEKDAQIAALTKQIEELKAMPVEPLCVMPGRMEKGSPLWVIDSIGNVLESCESGDCYDDERFAVGNYFSSERQAAACAHAVSVMRLMRRQPGVVGADAGGKKWRPEVWSGNLTISAMGTVVPTDSYCMFPCYSSEELARAAIEAVGGEDALRRCAEYWSGVMK